MGIVIGGADWSPYSRMTSFNDFSGGGGFVPMVNERAFAAQADADNRANIARHQNEFYRQAMGMVNPDIDTGTYQAIEKGQNARDDRARSIYQQGLENMRQAKMDEWRMADRAAMLEQRKQEQQDRLHQLADHAAQNKRNATAAGVLRQAQQLRALAAKEGVDPEVAQRAQDQSDALMARHDMLVNGQDAPDGMPQLGGLIGQMNNQANQFKQQGGRARVLNSQIANAGSPEAVQGLLDSANVNPRGQGLYAQAFGALDKAGMIQKPVTDDQLAGLQAVGVGRADYLKEKQQAKNADHLMRMVQIGASPELAKEIQNADIDPQLKAELTAANNEKYVERLDRFNEKVSAREQAMQLKQDKDFVIRAGKLARSSSLSEAEQLAEDMRKAGKSQDEIDNIVASSPTIQHESYDLLKQYDSGALSPRAAAAGIQDKLAQWDQQVQLHKKDGTPMEKGGAPVFGSYAEQERIMGVDVQALRKRMTSALKELEGTIAPPEETASSLAARVKASKAASDAKSKEADTTKEELAKAYVDAMREGMGTGFGGAYDRFADSAMTFLPIAGRPLRTGSRMARIDNTDKLLQQKGYTTRQIMMMKDAINQTGGL